MRTYVYTKEITNLSQRSKSKILQKSSEDLNNVSIELSIVSNLLDIFFSCLLSKFCKEREENLAVLAQCSGKPTFLLKDKKFQKLPV